MQYIGKYLIVAGFVLVSIGTVLVFSGKIPWLGRLPGDILIKKENFTFYFPITTSVLLSVVLSAVAYFLTRKQ